MSSTELLQASRRTCRRCGSTMRHVGDSQRGAGGHHRTVFYCPGCDTKRERG